MGFSWRQALRYAEAKGRVFLRSSWAAMEMAASGRPRQAPDEGWLILPRLDGIGDFWLWLPLVSSFKRAFPDRKLHLLANALWADLAIATGLFDWVTPLFPQKLLRSPTYRRRIWQQLKESPSGSLFNTTFRRRIAAEDSIAWFYPASYRVAASSSPDAIEPPPVRKAIEKKLYDKVIEVPFGSHEWSRYEHFTQRLGLSMGFGVYEELYAVFEEKVPSLGQGKPFIAVIIGAAALYRVPSSVYMAHLLQRVYAATGLPLELLGGRAEVVQAETLQRNLPSVPVQNLVGRLSLTEAVRHLRRAMGVIGTETGLSHIAATWGKPTLVLMGGGHWGRFFPYPSDFPYQPFILHQSMSCYGCGWFCRYSLSRKVPYPCIATLDQAPMEPLWQWLHAVSAHKRE